MPINRTAALEAVVQHCVQEIAHDGDLGSNLSRLAIFVNEYYERHPSDEADHERQHFHNIVEVVRNEPHIVAGLAPTGDTEVLIRHPDKTVRRGVIGKKPVSQTAAPEVQTNEQQPKAGAAEANEAGDGGGDVSMAEDTAKAPLEGLQLVPRIEYVPLLDLIADFGPRLRVAVDPEFACYTLTGLPNRNMPRTNPRMYTCLQFIARARQVGVSADALAAATGYDQKICYHHIRHLVSLDLIFKVRKNDFTRVDYCIHRDYRASIPPEWTIRSGKDKGETAHDASARGSVADDAEFESGSERLDPKHEASPRLLRERILGLLKENPSAIPFTQLFAAVGYTKADTRATEGADWDFFCVTVEEMVRDGELVKALKKAAAGAPVLCVRLPNDEPPDPVAARMQASRMRIRKSVNNGANLIDDDDSGMDVTSSYAGGNTKRAADEAASGEPPAKRKRGRPRKDDGDSRPPPPEPKPVKKDEPAREPSPPWASKRKGGPRPPSPVWVPRRIPTPPWVEGDRPGRPKTPPAPVRHTPTTLAKMDAVEQANFAANMIISLEQRNESLVAGSELLSAKDLRTLLPGHLPNETVIDGLNDMMMLTTRMLPKVRIGPSILYKYICDAKAAEGTNNSGNETRLWGKVLQLQETINLFALHRFVIPILLSDRWICACIDFKASMISIYDSLPRPVERFHTNTIRALSTWLDHEAKARNHPGPDWKLWKADSTPKEVVKSDVPEDTGFYTWMFARTLIMQERLEMNFRLDVASERVWLIVDGIQSLEHRPTPPRATTHAAAPIPRIVPQIPATKSPVVGTLSKAPTASASRPPPPPSSAPAAGPPPVGPVQQHQQHRPPPVPRPAAPPGQRPPPPPQHHPSPAPSSAGSRPSPDMHVSTRPRQGSSASLASLPALPSPAISNRPRQGSGAHPPLPPHPQAPIHSRVSPEASKPRPPSTSTSGAAPPAATNRRPSQDVSSAGKEKHRAPAPAPAPPSLSSPSSSAH